MLSSTASPNGAPLGAPKSAVSLAPSRRSWAMPPFRPNSISARPSSLLFLILVFWQMPHFYAIAIYRAPDYRAARLPVLPAVKGMATTVRRMIIYATASVTTIFALPLTGATTWLFGLVTGLVGIFWLQKVFAGLRTKDYEAWAKTVFRTSLLVLLTLCLMSVVDLIVRSL
jgi:heme o synthase